MNFELNETERMLADTLIRFVQDASGMGLEAQRSHAREMGWHGASVPEELGGMGMGLVAPMLIAEHLGQALSPLNWQSEAALPAIALTALAEAGQSGPLDAFLAGEGASYDISDNGISHADGPAVDAPLDRLQLAAEVTAAAYHLGAMQRLFDMTLDYTRTRQQFGRALSSFQALQHRLVDMFVAIDETRALVMAAAMAADEGRADAARLARAAWTKAQLSGQLIAEESIQMHGGIGMTAECQVGSYVRQILRNKPQNCAIF